jgi:thiol-disulfide isomerase/thioredoxin
MKERIHAPDFTGATAWLNVEEPLEIGRLRGHVVVLDFWTYCCVNCMHVLPILRDLEERHRNDPLVVIGVHSAKFDAEKDPQHILGAMRRYGVEHPVAVDSEMKIWTSYAVRSWPTLVIIRPDGTLAAIAPGEPDPAVLEAVIQRQLVEGRESGMLAEAPLHLARRRKEPDRPLSYPGKVAWTDGRIVVADSGHHRVLILDEKGEVTDAIGSGLRGLREGSFAEAALDDPQGLAARGDELYIADARTHSIFRADLKERTIARFAGTGELGRVSLSARTRALETALRSPWDLAIRGDELFVALAGSHQIAAIDLRNGFIEPVAGNGREALADGKGPDAALAQPSGLALQGEVLYVADSESSGVRAIDLRSRKVYTMAGGPGLFDFGDAIGPVRPGMLQHPLAVAATRSSGLLVADTYNDKIKRFSPDGLRLEPFFQGAADSKLSQPAGLAVLPDGEVLVADTNNHRIVLISRDGEKAFELAVYGAPEPRRGVAMEPPPVAPASPGTGSGWFTSIIEAPPGTGLARGEGTIVLALTAPQGFELSAGAPWSLALEVSRRSDLLTVTPEFLRGESRGGAQEEIAIHASCSHDGEVDSELIVQVRTVVCDAADHAACYPLSNAFRIPLRLLAQGQAPQAELRVPLALELGAAR